MSVEALVREYAKAKADHYAATISDNPELVDFLSGLTGKLYDLSSETVTPVLPFDPAAFHMAMALAASTGDLAAHFYSAGQKLALEMTFQYHLIVTADSKEVSE